MKLIQLKRVIKCLLFLFVAFSLTFVVPTAGKAEAALINNGSFESNSGNPFATSVLVLKKGSNFLNSWTINKGSVDYISGYWSSSNGDHSIDMSGNKAGTLSQYFNAVKGQTYKLTFDLAGNPIDKNTDNLKTLNVAIGGINQDFTFNTSGSSLSDMGWTPQSFLFTASSTGSTLLKFTSRENSAYGPALDNVNLTEVPTPEPSLYWLGLMAIGGLFVIKMRKAQSFAV